MSAETSKCRVCGKVGINQTNPQGRVIGPPQGWSSMSFTYPPPIENFALCEPDAATVRVVSQASPEKPVVTDFLVSPVA